MIPSEPITTGQKPLAEILVEGELSPFEHETLYRILRKSFRVEHPSYTELSDDDLATRVNVTFHHPYTKSMFTEVLQENWRDLKELLKQVTYRRGRAGAAFRFTFVMPETRLIFNSGPLSEKELSSALDQIGHLTAIVTQMLRPETMMKQIGSIETTYDRKSDTWQAFQGSSSTDDKFVFDETEVRWVPTTK